MIVVDASLAVKWLVPESDSEAAIAIARDHDDIHGPDILLTEVISAIVRRCNERILLRGEAERTIGTWTNGWSGSQIVAHRLDGERARQAAALALELGHPLADCIYLALAIELDCELVTCDAKFAAKARTIYPAIRLLTERD